METKICRKCLIEKHVSEFQIYGCRGYIYLHSWCKQCKNDASKKSRKIRSDDIKQYKIKYNQEHSFQNGITSKKWKLEHQDKVKHYQSEHNKRAIMCNNIRWNINNCPDNIRPVLGALIAIRHKNKMFKEMSHEQE